MIFTVHSAAAFDPDRPPLGSPLYLALCALCLLFIGLVAFGCEHDDHQSSSDAAAAHGNTAAVGTASAAPGGAAASDPLPPGSVSWCYGGFNGSRAAHDPRCRVSSLRVNNPSGLSLRWESGIPADWARGQGGFVVVALFFQAADGAWKGGKIDWIDTARSTRDLKNPAAGYGGWNWGEYLAARKHALVVVSADGKKRSNWIFD